MARKKVVREKDFIDQMLDSIDFRGLTQDEVVGQGGLIKQLTGRILQRALEAEMTEDLGYENMRNIRAPETIPGIAGTDTRKRRCSWKTKVPHWKYPETGTVHLSH